MQTVPLTSQHSAPAKTLERGDEAAIVGELARHLLEHAETTSKTRTQILIQKLATLAAIDPPTLWIFLTLLSGDLAEITRSYSEMGKESGRKKQAVQQELERSLSAIRKHYPELEGAIVILRQITADYKRPNEP